ncbi:MAG: RluA family pseudouridine synthase [Solobacterium sp.]|nr:RluA family pseudouridine synthase [Solobacterium sp.]
MRTETYTVDEDSVRIDRWLSERSEVSRSRIQELIDEGRVTVNGKEVRTSYKVCSGDTIVMEVPDDTVLDVLPEDIPLDILYEDHDILIVNKPKGMVVHPAPGVSHGTLVNAVLYHCDDLSGINGVLRPGIVHRIDKDTTGCIVVCKNDKAHESIAAQLADKTCHREYLALVKGIIHEESGMIDAPIGRDARDRQKMCVTERGGRSARTRFRVLERFSGCTLVECTLDTGRTHQIRVHMKYIGHPVIGDVKYYHPCRLQDTQGQVLHAYRITLVHPRTGETITAEAPLPAYFEALLKELREGRSIE